MRNRRPRAVRNQATTIGNQPARSPLGKNPPFVPAVNLSPRTPLPVSSPQAGASADPIDVVVTDGGIAIEGEGYGIDGRTGDEGIGVYGVSDVGTGVEGESDSGIGVYGYSDKGTGVIGFSLHGLAGFFEGNITVTGNVNGVDLKDLLRRIQVIEDRLSQSQPAVGAFNSTLQLLLQRGAGGKPDTWNFTGSGFVPDSQVNIVVVDEPGIYREEIDVRSDSSGEIRGFRSVNKRPPFGELYYAATDLTQQASDLTGIRWTGTGKVS